MDDRENNAKSKQSKQSKRPAKTPISEIDIIGRAIAATEAEIFDEAFVRVEPKSER